MKIVYVIQQLSIRGGIERIVADKASLLAERYGYEVSIICLDQKDEEPNVFSCSPLVKQINLWMNLGLNTLPYKNPVKFLYRWLKWNWKYNSILRRELAKLHPDVVIVTHYAAPISIYFFSGKFVLESHTCLKGDTYLTSFRKQILFRYVARRCCALVALTERDAASWTTAPRVEVIPNFTKIEPVSPCRVATKRAMAVGRLEDQKGFDLLIDAWVQVARKHPDWTLDIYGKGRLRGQLQQQIEERNLSAFVQLHQAVDHIAKEYAEHSIYILSSRFEGFVLTLLEAMTCGMPCVAFDCAAGPSEMIDDGKNGILVPYEHLSREERVCLLAEGICRMMENDTERARMGMAAMEKARLFDKDGIMGKWDALFRSLVEK